MIVFGPNITQGIWETAAILLVVLPLVALWFVSMIDTVLRKDLARYQKILLLVGLILFPVVGTLFYLYRRASLRQQVSSLRELGPLAATRQTTAATLHNLAMTVDLTDLTLKQSAELLDEITKTLAETGSTVGFVLPLTHVRPLGLVEDRVTRLTTQLRTLRLSVTRTSDALGSNANDLRSLAREIDKLNRLLGDETSPKSIPGPGAIGLTVETRANPQ